MQDSLLPPTFFVVPDIEKMSSLELQVFSQHFTVRRKTGIDLKLAKQIMVTKSTSESQMRKFS